MTRVPASTKQSEASSPPPRGASVRVRGLVKDYGDVRAVDGVDLEVRPGEILALLGPSGSGKTTILMTIAGFEAPTAGRILVDDRDITHVRPEQRRIGMVFQSYALFPHMTVADNIAFPLRMQRVPKGEIGARVEAAMRMVRLEEYGSRRPAQLSGGQQQRVALARAIVGQPTVLLADEPLGALDKKLREHLQLEIKHLQRELGLTAIYVTHDQDEALKLADRIAVIHDGRVAQIGTPEDLYERPADTFVADFIGEINFVGGSLRTEGGGAMARVELNERLSIAVAAPDPDAGPRTEGRRVVVAVRPERISLHGPGEAEGPPDRYAGVVEERIYAGDATAYVVRLADAKDTTVRARLANIGGGARWQVGDHVEIAWPVEAALVYEADGDG
jgi:putative spermidine/putrescine transport system ATP-binding protein/mannopine transport system ATP-binding protein